MVSIDHARDSIKGPQIKVRADVMTFSFNVFVDDPFAVGQMINTWYASWIDLVFEIAGEGISVDSADTNPVKFSHDLTYVEKVCTEYDEFRIKNDEICIKIVAFCVKMMNFALQMKDFNLDNTASEVTDTITKVQLQTSTDTALQINAFVLFNLTESVSHGWGFPPFDITIPSTHFYVYTYGPEGYLNYSLATLQTLAVAGHNGGEFLGPMGLLLHAKGEDSEGLVKWVTMFVNNALGCVHAPWRTLSENKTLSIQIVGDASPVYQEKCTFQEAITAVSYPLFAYPYSDNATTSQHNVRVHRLSLITTPGGGGLTDDDRLEMALVLGNGTDASILNVLADLPSFNLELYGQLEAEESHSELLTGLLAFDRARFAGRSSAALGVSLTQVGRLLNTLVETSMDNITMLYDVDVTPATSGQGFLAQALHAAATAASTCLLQQPPPPLLLRREEEEEGEGEGEREGEDERCAVAA